MNSQYLPKNSYIQRSLLLSIITNIIFLLSGCGDSNDFPERQFIGYIDLTDPNYSQKSIFIVRRDSYGNYLGINGVVVYKQGNQYYAFDIMCPYEKKETCSIEIDSDEETIVTCKCCGSTFLVASPDGDLISGPAPHGLKKYNTKVVQNTLIINSSY